MNKFSCMVCGQSDYKILKWPNFLIAHWRINPGLAFNELVLGQRLPEQILCCSHCHIGNATSNVRCQNCGEIYNYYEFGGFGYWLGYLCPKCNSRIPTSWNFTSKIILIFFAPILRVIFKKFVANYPAYIKNKMIKARPKYEKIILKYQKKKA